MPRDVSLSESKCWNGGHEWVKLDKIFIDKHPVSKMSLHVKDVWGNDHKL